MKALLRAFAFVCTMPLLIGHGVGTLPWEEEHAPEPCTEMAKVRDFQVDSPCLDGTIKVRTFDCIAASVELPHGQLAGDAWRDDGDVVIFPLNDDLRCTADLANGDMHCEQCLVNELGEYNCQQDVCVGTIRPAEKPADPPNEDDVGVAPPDAGEPGSGVDGDAAPSDAGPGDGGVDAGSDGGDDGGVDAALSAS